MDETLLNNQSPPFTRNVSLRSAARTTLMKRYHNQLAKQVCFYRNGDAYFSGLKLAVSQERYKHFDSLLRELSEKLNMPNGAVRYIFNSEDNSLIQKISDLQPGIAYVCSSTSTYKPIEGGYGRHLVSRSGSVRSKEDLPRMVCGGVENSDCINKSARDFIKPKLLTVVKNSKPPQQKVTLLLNKKTAVSLDQVFDQLSAKGCLGRVEKLCAVDGTPVKTLRDLFTDNNVFVSLGTNEKFPEGGIDWDPNNLRVSPRGVKKTNEADIRRANSLRVRNLRNDNNFQSSGKSDKRGTCRLFSFRLDQNKEKEARPRSSPRRNNEQIHASNTSPSFQNQSPNTPEHNDYSMFGIKKDKQRLHSSYRIGRIIGDGNFAIVRECVNRSSKLSYALKVIDKEKVKGREHFVENEIHILRKVSHPNIVKLYDEFETSKEIYLVMELVATGDLFDAVVSNSRFSEPDSAYMVRDLTSAIKYLHDMNIVHRDIKPENLLVLSLPYGKKSIKLADFGLSTEVKSRMFLVCGTPSYVAPEILDESGYDLKVDIWSIGVICYILLCGFPPFRSTNQEELFDKILRGDFEYPTPFWDEISEGPKNLIDKILVVDPSKRITVEDILSHFWIKRWTEIAEVTHQEAEVEDSSIIVKTKQLCETAPPIQHEMRKNQDYISSSILNPPSTETSITDKIVNRRDLPGNIKSKRADSGRKTVYNESSKIPHYQSYSRTRPVSLLF